MIESILYILILSVCFKPLGGYIARVHSSEKIYLEKWFGKLEQLLYRASGVNVDEMNWREYASAFMAFSLGGFVLLAAILTTQHLSMDLIFDITSSFITNTNFQTYTPETTLNNYAQTIGLTVQNFLSASCGIIVLIAFSRGFVRKNTSKIGNFWIDLVRTILYILLPLSFVFALIFVSQGVIQTFAGSIEILEKQTIPAGAVASQEAIKILGSNGGGFYNANSAHPFENPTPLANFISIIAILLIPSALCYTFGKMVEDTRQGYALLVAKLIIFIPAVYFVFMQEQYPAPKYFPSEVNISLGNMEGKEVRNGIFTSALWTVATTATANGAVNSSLESYTQFSGTTMLLFLHLGEIVFGGVGSGLYAMLIYVLISVFIAGLMIGRTPEYLGKKINAFEIKMASLVILIPTFVILIGTAFAIIHPATRDFISEQSPLGFTEVLYSLSSSTANNGSSFAGLNANNPFFNNLLGLAMLVGRFCLIIPVLAISGALAEKNITPTNINTLQTHTPLFICFLVGVIMLICLLGFIPALAFGPLMEYMVLAYD